MAREQLDITVVILNNHAYAILQLELKRVGASAGRPQGAVACSICPIPASTSSRSPKGSVFLPTRATTAEELATHFSAAIAEPGPHLIDVVVPAASFG